MYANITEPSLYLAGSATDCLNWQIFASDQLAGKSLTVLNPRSGFDPKDPTQVIAQQEWSHEYVGRATAVLAWFPDSSDIGAAFELCQLLQSKQRVFVGIAPVDGRIGLETAINAVRPDVHVYATLEQTIQAARDWLAVWIARNGDRR